MNAKVVQMKKRPFTIKRTIDLDKGTILFLGYDSQERPTGHSARIDVNKLSGGEMFAELEGNLRYAVLHGVNQTVTDQAALGQGSTLTAKFEAMKDRIEWLESGAKDWTGSRRGPSDLSILVQAALLQNPNRNAEAFRKFAEGKGKNWVTAALNSAELKEFVDKVKGPLPEIDLESELAEFDAI